MIAGDIINNLGNAFSEVAG